MSLRLALGAGVSALLLAIGLIPPPPTSADPPAPGPAAHAPAASTPAAPAATQAPRLLNGRMLTRGVALHAVSGADHRGVYSGQVLTINLSATSVRVEAVTANRVTQRGSLGQLAGRPVAAVNGDFFDIGGTGAPRGFGITRSRGLLHGPEAGWNNAFFMTRTGRVGIGPLNLQGRLVEFPTVQVSGVNSPSVADNSIGIYNGRWGSSINADALTGGDRDMRTVVIRGGRVVLNAPIAGRSIPPDGYVLVARGNAASQMLAMPPGRVVTPRAGVQGDPALAIGGSGLLLSGRQIVNRANTTAAPRTAVAYDRVGNRLFLIVIDGRSSRSRGATHYEMAALARALGAHDALNLDGGGSTTMLASVGGVRLANRPSDGRMRAIPNGIALYQR